MQQVPMFKESRIRPFMRRGAIGWMTMTTLVIFLPLLWLLWRPSREFASLVFNGLVISNGVSGGSFTVTNLLPDRINFYVNNMEIKEPDGWSYYASWALGSRTNRLLGSLNNYLDPAQSTAFFVPAPSRGQAWRVTVGIMRGRRELTLRDRAMILSKTRSITAALSPTVRSNDFNFSHVGFVRGPEIDSSPAP
jgi:hypothetical protein